MRKSNHNLRNEHNLINMCGQNGFAEDTSSINSVNQILAAAHAYLDQIRKSGAPVPNTHILEIVVDVSTK